MALRFNLALGAIMAASDLELAEVQRRSGVRSAHIKLIARDGRKASPAIMRRIAQAYGVDLDEAAKSIESERRYRFARLKMSTAAHAEDRGLLLDLFVAGISTKRIDDLLNEPENYSAAVARRGKKLPDRWTEMARSVLESEDESTVAVVSEGAETVAASRGYQRAKTPAWRDNLRPSDRELVAALDEAGISVTDVNRVVGYSQSYAQTVWATRKRPSVLWYQKAERLIYGDVRTSQAPKRRREWTPDQKRIYDAIWASPDATVATAMSLYPELPVRLELRRMGIPEENWP